MPGARELCAAIRRWPREVEGDFGAVASATANAARLMFGAPEAALIWEEAEEPFVSIAHSREATTVWLEGELVEWMPLVAEKLADATFLTKPTGRRVVTEEGERTIARPINARVAALIGHGPTLSFPIESTSGQGRVFVREPGGDFEMMLIGAATAAALIGMSWGVADRISRASDDAVNDERLRVARDLHDGLLQSFTGVVLQLETAHSGIRDDPDGAKKVITNAQSMLMADQRELRRFVEQLRPRSRIEPAYDFHGSLDELRARFEAQWGIKVAVDVARIDPLVAKMLGAETFRLIQEAVTNSAKHGRATEVHVGIRTAGSNMQIEVSDNGVGFPFHGRRSLAELRMSGGGPMVLAERISSLNGELVVESTHSGAVVSMSVPLGWGSA